MDSFCNNKVAGSDPFKSLDTESVKPLISGTADALIGPTSR